MRQARGENQHAPTRMHASALTVGLLYKGIGP